MLRKLIDLYLIRYAVKRLVKMLNEGAFQHASYEQVGKYRIADIMTNNFTGEQAFIFEGAKPIEVKKPKKIEVQ